jgi:hypothetical protein
MLRVMRARALAIGLALLGCSDGGGNTEAPCQPFGALPEPIMLSNVLAIGRDMNDVIYVLDEPDGEEPRAFRSSADRLVRQHVSGTSTGTDVGIKTYHVHIEAEPAYALYLEISDDVGVRFVRQDGPVERVMPGEEPEGEVLEVLDEVALDDLTLENFPPDVYVEYLGNLEDGRRVLVTRPEEDWDYEDFRVFLGTKDAMVEHAVESVVRQRDGGTTTIVILLDGESATLHFAIEMVGMQFVAGPAMLTLGDGSTVAIDLVDASPDAINQHTFVCN